MLFLNECLFLLFISLLTQSGNFLIRPRKRTCEVGASGTYCGVIDLKMSFVKVFFYFFVECEATKTTCRPCEDFLLSV